MAATGLYSAGGPASAAAGQPQNQVQTDYNRSRSPGRELDDPSAGNYYPGGQQVIIKLYTLTRVSVQGVKSLGGHFACLCRGFEHNFFWYYFSKKMEILLHF